MIGRAQGESFAPSAVYQGWGSVILLQLLRQGEGIKGSHVLIKGHARAFRISRALLPHGQIAKQHELLRGAQLGSPLVELRLPVLGPQGGGPREHGGSIFLFCADAQHPFPFRGLHKGPHLIALEDHVLIVGTDTAPLKHRRAQGLLKEVDELAKMGGPLYGCPGKAQLIRHFIVVNGQVAVVFLRAEHLPRVAIGSR